MGLFDSKEEKEKEARYQQAVKQIIIFPGSVAEYERFQRYETEVIDTKRENKGVSIVHKEGNPPNIIKERELGEYLIHENIEAIVNATRIPVYSAQNVFLSHITYYGLPVRRKKER